MEGGQCNEGMWNAVSIRDSRATFRMEIGFYIRIIYWPRDLMTGGDWRSERQGGREVMRSLKRRGFGPES